MLTDTFFLNIDICMLIIPKIYDLIMFLYVETIVNDGDDYNIQGWWKEKKREREREKRVCRKFLLWIILYKKFYISLLLLLWLLLLPLLLLLWLLLSI